MNTPEKFLYDVFLSHSSKDKYIVRSLAEMLRMGGLEVWFDEWEIKPGDSIPAKIEMGLESSRVLVFCISLNTVGSEWSQLESYTFRFRDPLNNQRRFIPLRLDDAPLKGSMAQFLYIDWRKPNQKQEYQKLVDACRKPNPSKVKKSAEFHEDVPKIPVKTTQLKIDPLSSISTYAFSADGKTVLTGSSDNHVRLWDVGSGDCILELKGHSGSVYGVAWSDDNNRILSCGEDQTIRLWDKKSRKCIRVYKGHTNRVYCVTWSPNQHQFASGSEDGTVRIWDAESDKCLRSFQAHHGSINSTDLRIDRRYMLSGSDDGSILIWDLNTSGVSWSLKGHTDIVWNAIWCDISSNALSASFDNTIRLWDLQSERCLRVFEGHSDQVRCLAWNSDKQYFLSGSDDRTIRLWDARTGYCLLVLHGHNHNVFHVEWSFDQLWAHSADEKGGISIWDFTDYLSTEKPPIIADTKIDPTLDQVRYTNAKVLLVGETSAGKTGLSKVLAGEDWQPSDSTVGAWATQWKLPVFSDGTVEREIWLWDFGGQADQRLIHQLYMDETALAVLVFDGQKEDLFETLGQWDRDLSRASRTPFSKLLVAGRVDAGGLRASRAQIETFRSDRNFIDFIETSAKTGLNCEKLKQAILSSIKWDDIPCRTTVVLFKRLKEEIVQLKDEGRVLMRFNELREALQIRLSGIILRFSDDELHAVLSLLAGPGVVWKLKFGNWVLLQPERINAYAQAVIQTMRNDEHERGCLSEELVLNGALTYHSSMKRLNSDEERFIILAMHQILVERGLCLREQTEHGAMLIFPSYYRRERPDLVGHPAVLVSYRFNGFLDDIYASLVVRLHHTETILQDQLWRYAADFKTYTGKQWGVKLIRRAEGAGELKVYFDLGIEVGEKIIFSKYVHEHLLKHAQDVERLRHYVCPHCGTPVGNREVAMRRLEEGKKDIICVNCEQRIKLWDEMEELFASDITLLKVREMEEQSAIVLDNDSKERALVGEVISTVALAGQLCREFNVSDHGIDMEIEFKSDNGEATGQKLYLQLKSGDSYLRKRKTDGAEIFTIPEKRHASYWMNQAFPVLLVIRDSSGDIRWMEVRDWLKQQHESGKPLAKQIKFEGQRFDVMSVRHWRDKVLREAESL